MVVWDYLWIDVGKGLVVWDYLWIDVGKGLVVWDYLWIDVGRGLVVWDYLWIDVGVVCLDILALLSRVSLYLISDSIFLSRKAATIVPILKATRKLTTN